MLAAGLGCAPPAAAADTCTPVERAELALQVEHRSPFVAMTLDGGAATFLLDTGAERTVVSTEAAHRLGLAAHYTTNSPLAGLGGAVPTGEVHPSHVTLGGTDLSGFFALVAQLVLPKLHGQPADGLLGGDVLDGFDLDIDLIDQRLFLFTPVQCAQPLLPWHRAIHATDAHISLRRRLVFDVQIDGRTLPAFIDTGAQSSFIDIAAAARLGVGEAELRKDPPVNVRGIGNAESGLRLHRFAAVMVAGVAWSGPVLVAAPLHLDDADVILGADFLETHRVWFAYQGRHLFIAAPG